MQQLHVDHLWSWGKWKTLKCGNPEVRKRKYGNGSKYGSEKKSCLSVSSALLTHVPCSQRVTVSKQCESQVLTHRTPASTNTVTSGTACRSRLLELRADHLWTCVPITSGAVCRSPLELRADHLWSCVLITSGAVC